MQTRIITGLVLGSLGLAALTTAGNAQDYRAARGVEATAVQRTGSINAPRAYTSSEGRAVASQRVIGAYENTLHLFGARTDNAPF